MILQTTCAQSACSSILYRSPLPTPRTSDRSTASSSRLCFHTDAVTWPDFSPSCAGYPLERSPRQMECLIRLDPAHCVWGLLGLAVSSEGKSWSQAIPAGRQRWQNTVPRQGRCCDSSVKIFERVSLCTMKLAIILFSLKEIPVKLDHWA